MLILVVSILTYSGQKLINKIKMEMRRNQIKFIIYQFILKLIK